MLKSLDKRLNIYYKESPVGTLPIVSQKKQKEVAGGDSLRHLTVEAASCAAFNFL